MSGAEASFTEMLADHVTSMTYEQCPQEVAHQAKRLILDCIGCAYGGYHTEAGRLSREAMVALGGVPESTIVGCEIKTSCDRAVYVNSRTANVLDIDDTFNTPAHFGVATVFAALAACERQKASGKDLIASVVAGFELAARFSSTIGNPYMVEEGKSPRWSRVSVVESLMFASAGAAARALGLDLEQTMHAIGIAGANTPISHMHVLEMRKEMVAKGFDAPHFKYADYGFAPMGGVIAALIAQRGFTGFPTILDKDSDFWSRFERIDKDFELLIGGLGSKWYIMDTAFKQWPSCRWNHGPLTAFIKVLREHDLRAEEIEKVTVYGAPNVAYFATIRHPQDPLGCEFSIPHNMAMAAFGVPPGPAWLDDEVVNRKEVREFRERVFGGVHPRVAEMGKCARDGQWRKVPARAEVVARGRTYECEVDYAKGDPWSAETYFTDEDIKSKFRILAASMTPSSATWEERAEQIIDDVFKLEMVDDVNNVSSLLYPQAVLSR